MPSLSPLLADDFLRVGGDVTTLAASFGNSWRIPEAGTEVSGPQSQAALLQQRLTRLCGLSWAGGPMMPFAQARGPCYTFK